MSGLVLNGERPLDLAAERDNRVNVQGDVHLLMSLPRGLPMPGSSIKFNSWQQVGYSTVLNIKQYPQMFSELQIM